MHVKKAHKVILSIFLTTLFLSLQFVVGGRLTYADSWKSYNSNGQYFDTGSYTNGRWTEFKTIGVYADQSGWKVTHIFNPTANGSYPIVSYSFVEAGFSSISSNFSYTSSKEVVVSGLSLGHMYTTYSNSGIEQVVKLDGPDANQSTNLINFRLVTDVNYYLLFGSIDTSIRPQFTATPSQYNGINYNLYSVDRQYIDSEEGAYNLTGFNLGSEIRWMRPPNSGITIRDLTLVQDVNVPQNGVYIDDSISASGFYLKPVAGANVTAKYVDENGKTISDDVVKNGNIGDDYSTEQKAIPGYTLNFIKYSASGGQFTDKEQTITYVYTKNSVTPVKPTEPGTTQTNENNTETPVKNTTNVSLNNNVSTLGSVSTTNEKSLPTTGAMQKEGYNLEPVSTTNEKSLPTTGEKPANWAVVVGGLIPLTAATVLYLLKRKY